MWKWMAALSAAAMMAAPATAGTSATDDPAGARWWRHVEVLAGDETAGRLPGTPGYEKAAQYVEAQFKALGLKPAGVDGYRQPVGFEVLRVDAARSAATLSGPEGTRPLAVGEEVLFSARLPPPKTFDAPLVFVGYGLHVPEVGYDDLKGVDLKGKIAVMVGGGPTSVPGNVKAWALTDRRTEALAARGAVGVIGIQLPSAMDIPWPRLIKLSSQSAMHLADPSLRPVNRPFLTLNFNPAHAEALFAGSGHTLAEVLALAEAGKPQTGFALKTRVKGHVTTVGEAITSPNLIARLDGADPKLSSEYVVVSAHLDHLGVGEPINGQNIYRGAMDDASGVASVLEIARGLAKGPKPKRSILFAVVTAEEQGLLGSRYFARRPTVPAKSIIADLNFDMPLPLFPLKTVILYGYPETTLTDTARQVADPRGLKLVPDPQPNRNAFTRTDMFSFVTAGVPAMAFSFGYDPGSPEEKIKADWRTLRYHSPADDLAQPLDRAAAVKLDDFVTDMALAVANTPQRPAWHSDSFFRRFAKPAPAKKPKAKA
jgi:Zn-dependent M28 family amino/carboxypeptidase